MKTFSLSALALVLALTLAACGGDDSTAEYPVHSHLSGRISVRAEVDSIPNYRGFEVLVFASREGHADTLGYAVTDSTGHFNMGIQAPDQGLFPLVISRRGTQLKTGELIVADGDTTTLEAVLPMGNQPLRLRSPENAAWLAYRNTQAQYRNSLVQAIQQGQYTDETVNRLIMQTSSILWSLRETYPGTIGSEVGSAEAIAMLGGWNDSLAVARARQIEPDEAGYTEAVRVARQALSRLAGPDSALALVRRFQARADDPDDRAQLQQELVLAHMDAGQPDSALAAARRLKQAHPDSAWTRWADRAIYELENLQSGMQAPSFTAQALDGATLTLDDLRGQVVLLEFYAPQNTIYQRELDLRQNLFVDLGDHAVEIVSISLEPDTLLVEAFLEGRNLPGRQVIASGGLEGDLARQYNINLVPTRYLLDTEGRIAGKYVGAALPAVIDDARALLAESDTTQAPPS